MSDPAERREEPCRACDGTGWDPDVMIRGNCSTCGGTGSVKPTAPADALPGEPIGHMQMIGKLADALPIDAEASAEVDREMNRLHEEARKRSPIMTWIAEAENDQLRKLVRRVQVWCAERNFQGDTPIVKIWTDTYAVLAATGRGGRMDSEMVEKVARAIYAENMQCKQDGWVWETTTDWVRERMTIYARAAIAAMRWEGWVACSERMPTETGFYHVHPNPWLNMVACYWNARAKLWENSGNRDGFSDKELAAFTHWRPLPQPPEPEQGWGRVDG